MSRSKSSRRWLKEHNDDRFVLRSRREGYRSRASYKLLEIQQKDRLLRPGMHVIDLGAAPGGWSQLAAAWVRPRGRVVACDVLPMDALPDVEFIQGDFTEEAVLDQILTALANHPADLVMSDMAPNISGIRDADQARAVYLAELALDLCTRCLRHGGCFLVKLFQGAGFDAYLRDLRQEFDKVVVRKPGASRARSREQYLLARGYRDGV